jgi:glucosyl-dolichyl phosphate glucuronosyltransferase
MKPEISVVVSTFNRSKRLTATMENILKQEGNVPFELIVVDNNCTDDTAQVVDHYARQSAIVRYVFEPKQGVSHGRNAGIAVAESDLIAFTDDDVLPDLRWVSQIRAVFDARPDHGSIGGKVLPLWPSDPPAWLQKHHWSPLALLDYGDAMTIDSSNRRCLITANMAVRRRVFEEIGYFKPLFQKTKGSTCSIEDREIQERYWKVGGKCWFDPAIVVYADVQPERLLKNYHRRWHYAHGQLQALLGDENLKNGFRLLGVPGYLYRRLILEGAASVTNLIRGRRDEAFTHEIEARFSAGFIAQRILPPGTKSLPRPGPGRY